jgi:SAM-dependent methyltransferase
MTENGQAPRIAHRGLFARFHEGYVHDRRTNVLSSRLAALLPRGSSVLDVGAGDGLLAKKLLDLRPDVAITGVEIVLRPDAHVMIEPFDGSHLPFEDAAFDSVLLIDVLHHAERPRDLLGEARRVARRTILVKDSVLRGVGANATLQLMERLANAKHGIPMPERFWTPAEWRTAFAELELEPDSYTSRLGLYPFPADRIFERRLHFLTRLRIR